ncbi:hypothetical protein ACO2J1_13785 [Leptospira interrogans]|uniref:Uncharacterized protein n=1 Tax=Leptospira interrogans serovar Pomona TaxID=44276 RepID=A0AA40W8B6_LEPIR|nr:MULTISPECIES: hypothetical protein [Leptospira]AJR12848.1 hypothetical protein LIL_10246 [Leptospira interrogans serovar Linhai str. 56609]ASV06753.1 hypothetical protein B2G47_13530 [Leptospira interrogans serovar Canicola]ASV08749.1 hypothetical protein B2G50_06990 [Leptospira interrogans serovar Canicola]MBE8345135.1 hypothetical protein [Leptospira interrogans serovar Pomona]MBE8355064.1 hypothetical protein [Leptospira interrogans serovar Pomona]
MRFGLKPFCKRLRTRFTFPFRIELKKRNRFHKESGRTFVKYFLSFDFLSFFMDSIVRNFLQMAISKTDLGF